jgi:hypothetical protein
MDTKSIKELCLKLEAAMASLQAAKEARNLLDFKGHQKQVAVRIGDYTLSVSDFNGSYASKVIRGREMIHLGMIKVANANIDMWHQEVETIQSLIKAAAGE